MQSTISGQESELWRSFFVMRHHRELTFERRLNADASISSADFEIVESIIPTI